MKNLFILFANILFSVLVFAQPGTIDLTFNPGTGANGNVFTTSIQSNGKIIIGGQFTFYNGIARNRIARLNTDGTLDTNFNTGIGPDDSVSTISIQSDGKIIIGGEFTFYNGIARNRVARLNTDGTLDAAFNPGTGATNFYILTTSIQSDGKIIIGGDFDSYNGIARNGIARLNTNGTLDATFNPGTGVDGLVGTTSIQSNGKIIIGGFFTSYNGIARNFIARLNTDGTLDATFNPGTGADYSVSTTSIQSDGKIIIGGEFYSYNGIARNGIARLNTNGILDATFNPGAGAGVTSYSVRTFSIQSDGKIIIGGQFTSYDGIARNGIARLNTNGTLDATFNPGTGTGADGGVATTSIQSDGQLIIGGWFTSYNGTGRNRVSRINGGNALSTLDFEKDIMAIYPNPSKGVFNLISNYELELKYISVYTLLGQKIFSKEITNKETSIDISDQPKGIYLYKIYDGNNLKVGKLIIE